MSDMDGDSDIYIKNLENGTLINISDNGVDDWYARWSPSGKWVSFFSQVEGVNSLNLYSVEDNKIKDSVNAAIQDSIPSADIFSYSWSLDSSKIIFDAWSNNNTSIYVFESNK